jgi:NitT/TauT family transport system substrate-binding protein
MGEATGPVPFTSYMASPAVLTREPDVVRRFTRAVFRTQRWLAGRPAAEVAAAAAHHFPELDAALRERAIARFQAQDTWARDPLLRRPGYDALQVILLTGGFIQRPHRYADLVNTAFARAAMESG